VFDEVQFVINVDSNKYLIELDQLIEKFGIFKFGVFWGRLLEKIIAVVFKGFIEILRWSGQGRIRSICC